MRLLTPTPCPQVHLSLPGRPQTLRLAVLPRTLRGALGRVPCVLGAGEGKRVGSGQAEALAAAGIQD